MHANKCSQKQKCVALTADAGGEGPARPLRGEPRGAHRGGDGQHGHPGRLPPAAAAPVRPVRRRPPGPLTLRGGDGDGGAVGSPSRSSLTLVTKFGCCGQLLSRLHQVGTLNRTSLESTKQPQSALEILWGVQMSKGMKEKRRMKSYEHFFQDETGMRWDLG